ncbi:ACT domain-containing protein [uncultured Selenomonas sp.]|uniref:ACT domain-containing protein n=1 Tax=uncultured Selenomonas sp. TaxID=159275 RepID=UPI0028DC43F2|nr:ACT domain-containing protein [uncultured Selenomonas sp.]
MKIDMTGVYLVREEILPKAIKKTILAKELLHSGEVQTVNEAVVRANLSRSAYYKYKDYVYSFFEATRDKIVTLSILLRHRSGTLQAVLQAIAEEGGNVMTLNQGLPARGAATVNISLETTKLRDGLQTLLEKVDVVDGVEKLEVIGQA